MRPHPPQATHDGQLSRNPLVIHTHLEGCQADHHRDPAEGGGRIEPCRDEGGMFNAGTGT